MGNPLGVTAILQNLFGFTTNPGSFRHQYLRHVPSKKQKTVTKLPNNLFRGGCTRTSFRCHCLHSITDRPPLCNQRIALSSQLNSVREPEQDQDVSHQCGFSHQSPPQDRTTSLPALSPRSRPDGRDGTASREHFYQGVLCTHEVQ